MRRRATIKAVYTLCEKALADKLFAEYTLHDRRLRFQRSALRNCWQMYDEFVLHQSDVMFWIKEFDQQGGESRVVADTWRWVLEINKKLPVKITRQR